MVIVVREGSVISVKTANKSVSIEDLNPSVEYYTADVVSYSDYYPFGMQMPGRNGTAGYRYGFNGMEKDNEVKGEGNSYDFGARLYDSRVGRWLSRDAIENQKADLSTYQAFRNNPIIFSDPDGNDEYLSIIIKNNQTGTTTIIRGHEAISNDVRAGAVHEFSAPSVWEYQNYYDFRRVITITIDEQGNESTDITYVTLTERKRYTKRFFSSTLSGVTTGTIVDPNARGFDWSLEGKGGSQKGGYTWVTKLGGASPTRQRALNPVEMRDIEDLITYFGAGNKSLYGDLPKNTDVWKDILNNAKSLIEEVKGMSSSSNQIEGKSKPMSNTEYMDKPKGTPEEKNGSTRYPANGIEKEKGDTVGGNPNVKIYPQSKK